MTEHLNKQIEDAASKVRSAKREIEEQSASILLSQSCIRSNEATIKSLESSNEYSYRAIEEAEGKRQAGAFKLANATRRYEFFMTEVVEHPYAAL